MRQRDHVTLPRVKWVNQSEAKQKPIFTGFSMCIIMCNHGAFALFDIILGANRSDDTESDVSAILLTKD